MSAALAAARKPVAPSRPARARWIAGLLCVAGVAVLPAFARRPPVLDLAPQFEQVTLLAPTLAGARPDLEVEWLAPNRLGYLPLLVGFWLGGAAVGPRIGLALVLALAAASIHLLAAARGRAPAAAVLATTFLLASPLYAGFFNFLGGLAALAFWGWELRPERRKREAYAVAGWTLLGAAGLAFAHVLWLAVGGAWVALVVLARRERPREIAARALGAAPVVLAVLVWHGRLLERGWGSTVEMLVPPLDRFTSPVMWASLLWGGLRSRVELALLALLVIWLAAALVAARRHGARIDSPMLGAAALFLAIAMLAPDKVDRTIFFAWRWAPMAAICLVLSLPPPKLAGRATAWLAAGMLLVLCARSAVDWRDFELEEMQGFEPVLAAIPEHSSLVALDFAHRSRRFRIDPFLHMAVYAATERDARLGFSFTEVGSSLVRARNATTARRSRAHLDYHPERLVPADLDGFDLLLVHGPRAVAAALVEQTGVLWPRTSSRDWHLLAVDRAALERRLDPASRAQPASRTILRRQALPPLGPAS